ncbi:hypothetical protein Emag_007400 [Eimeria magna]
MEAETEAPDEVAPQPSEAPEGGALPGGPSRSSKGAESELLLNVPEVFFAAVEIPGIIKQPSTVLNILGGAEAAARGLLEGDRGEPLLLRLGTTSSSSSSSSSGGGRSSSRWGHIAALKQSTAGLVLRRLERRSGAVEFEVLGRVTEKYTFTGLADFYFIPPRGHRGTETLEEQVVAEAQRACSSSSSSSSSVVDGPSEAPYIPPPFFCRGQGPFAYRVEAPQPPAFAALTAADTAADMQPLKKHRQQEQQQQQQQRQQQQQESPARTGVESQPPAAAAGEAAAKAAEAATSTPVPANAAATAAAGAAAAAAAPARAAAGTAEGPSSENGGPLRRHLPLSAAAKAAAARSAATQTSRPPRFAPCVPSAAAAATAATTAAATVSAAAAESEGPGIDVSRRRGSAGSKMLGDMPPKESLEAAAAAAADAAAAAAAAADGETGASSLPQPVQEAAEEQSSKQSPSSSSSSSSSSKEESAAFNAVGRVGDERLPQAPPPAAARAFAGEFSFCCLCVFS